MGEPQQETKDGMERPPHCLCGPSSQSLSPLCWVSPVEGCGAPAVERVGCHSCSWVGTQRGGWSRCWVGGFVGWDVCAGAERGVGESGGGCVWLVLTG